MCRKLIALLACLGLAACGNTTGLKPLENEIAKFGSGYSLFNPPRTNHGPGWIFEFARTIDGRTVPLTVCSNLLSDSLLSVGELEVYDINTRSTVDVGIAVDLLEGLIGDKNSAKAELASKHVKNVTIEWGNAREKEISTAVFQRAISQSGGADVLVDESCFDHLKLRADAGEGFDSLIIVGQALEVDELNYTLHVEEGFNLSADVNLNALLTVKPGVNIERTGDTTLKITAPRYIGYNAFAFDVLLISGQLTAGSATVKLVPVERAELRKLRNED